MRPVGRCPPVVIAGAGGKGQRPWATEDRRSFRLQGFRKTGDLILHTESPRPGRPASPGFTDCS